MIKESTTLITPVGRTIQTYQNLGYVCRVGKPIEILVDDLSLNSHHLITAVCDVCGQERKLSYYAYMKNWNKYEYYSCNNCKQDKIETTNKQLYGVRRPIQNAQIHSKLELTNIGRYGFACAVKSEQVKKRVPESKLKIENELLHEYRELDILSIRKLEYDIKCIKGHEYTISDINLYKRIKYGIDICSICNPFNACVDEIDDIFEYIGDNYEGKIEKEDNEVYLPGIRLQIIIIDLLDNSEVYREMGYYQDKINKLLDERKEYVLVYLDSLRENKKAILSMINKNIRKKEKVIYSDELKLDEIDSILAEGFTKENNTGEYVAGSINIGIFKREMLISMISFKKDGDRYELLSYIEKNGIRVIGGINRLYRYFIKKWGDSIFGYSYDINGEEMYKKIGFVYEKRMPIRYTYIVNKKRVSREYVRGLDLGFGKIAGKDEHRICLDNGIFRIYDAGRVKWVNKQ